jgi:hypothetical protein
LNERSWLLVKSAERGAAAKLVDAVPQSQVEPDRGALDPLIRALVDRLPKPNSIWFIDDRGNWLKAAAMAFNLFYKTDNSR